MGFCILYFGVFSVLTVMLYNDKVWTNWIINPKRRWWRRNPQWFLQRVGDGGSPIRNCGSSHPCWAGNTNGPILSRRFPRMLRQCIEVVGLWRGGEILFSQFEWYCGFVWLVSRTCFLRRFLFFDMRILSKIIFNKIPQNQCYNGLLIITLKVWRQWCITKP